MIRERFAHFRREISRNLSPQALLALKIGALVLLPAVILVRGEGYTDWQFAAHQIIKSLDLSTNSVYGVDNALAVNPREAFGYVYLPSFAIGLAAFLAPVRLPILALGKIGINLPEWVLNVATVTEWLVMGMLFYLAHLLTAYLAASFLEDGRQQVIAVVAMLGLPTLFYETYFLGPNIVMAALALAGGALAARRRWFAAGIVIGLSTFKFLGLPFAAVLFGYTVLHQERHAIIQVVAGGVVSQLPNLVYFVGQPDELLLILREHGAISSHANTLGASTYHSVIQALGIEQLYASVGFPIIVLLCSAIGILVAWRVGGQSGVFAGFLVGYFATSYLAPAEQRYAPFLVFAVVLILMSCQNRLLNQRAAVALILGLFIVGVYPEFIAKIGTDGPQHELLLPQGNILNWIRDIYTSGCGLGIVAKYWQSTQRNTIESTASIIED